MFSKFFEKKAYFEKDSSFNFIFNSSFQNFLFQNFIYKTFRCQKSFLDTYYNNIYNFTVAVHGQTFVNSNKHGPSFQTSMPNKIYVKVENSAQTTFRFSPVSFHDPLAVFT